MNPWHGLKGLPRGMWALALSTLVNRLGTMVVFFLALYLVQDRGWTAAEAATAMALYGAGALVASPFSGWVADRWGHKPTLAWSLGLSAVLLMLLPYAHARTVLLPLIALWSAATQSFWPAYVWAGCGALGALSALLVCRFRSCDHLEPPDVALGDDKIPVS